MAQKLGNANGTAAGTITSTKVSTQQSTISALQAIIAASAAYMPPAALATLQAQINALLAQQQSNKVTMQAQAYNAMLLAGPNGITKPAIITTLCPALLALTPIQLAQAISTITNVNWYVQQSFYTKQVPAWPVIPKQNKAGVTVYTMSQVPAIITARKNLRLTNTGLANRYNQFCAYYRAINLKVFSVPIAPVIAPVNNGKVINAKG